MADLDGKVAIVTDGTSGLGEATVEVLASDGAAVLVADINRDKAEQVAQDLLARGHRAASFDVDVGEEEQIRDMVGAAIRQFGRLDVLHNNAALTSVDVIGRDPAWADFDPALFERVLRVNLVGYALSAKYAIPQMISQRGGVVVNTSSTDAILSALVRPMYGASKAAINALTRSIATQYGRQGIRAVGVAPWGHHHGGCTRVSAAGDSRHPQQAQCDRARGHAGRRRAPRVVPHLGQSRFHHRHHHPGRRRPHPPISRHTPMTSPPKPAPDW